MRRGTRVGQAYVAVTADGDGINEEIVDAVDEAGPGVERAGKDHGERYGNRFSEGFFDRLRSRFSKQLGDRLSAHFERTGDESGASFAGAFTRHFARSDAGRHVGERLGGTMVSAMRERLGELDRDIAVMSRTRVSRNGGTNHYDTLIKNLRDAQKEASGLRRQLDALDKTFGNDRGRGRDLGDRVGRMFGAHSRNNFLNIFGRNIGMLTSATNKFMSVGPRFLRLLMSIGKGGSSGLSLSKVFTNLAAAAPAVASSLTAVIAALTIMSTVAGGLIGILTAMASTIVTSLVGGLAILGGAFAAVIAAGGLLTAAFMSMTDAQRNLLSTAFTPVKEEMVGIAQIMLRDMVPAFASWSANIQQAMLNIVPVARVMGGAFAEAGNILTRSFSGPGFQQFANALAVWLPSIVTRLASALGGFLNGLLGLFAALMPSVNRFAGYLNDVAQRFAAWATSAQGQNSIADWVDRAVASISSLWNFVSSFSGFLYDVLFSPQAQEAGSTIFDAMARKFQEFSHYIQQAAADGTLQQWFNEAINFGAQLWSVIEALGGVFMSLYQSGTITAVANALATMANVISAVKQVLDPLLNVIGSVLPYTLGVAMMPLQALASAVIAIGESVKWTLNLLGQANSVDFSRIADPWQGGAAPGPAPQTVVPGTFLVSKTPTFKMPKLPELQLSGRTALRNTSVDFGGYKPKRKKQFHNPYKRWAESLIKQGPSTKAAFRNAMLTLNKAMSAGIREATRDVGARATVESMNALYEQLKTGAKQAVNNAQQALNSAAQSLASAGSKRAMRRALREVRSAQSQLRGANAMQRRVNNVARTLTRQRVFKTSNVLKLIDGVRVQNATLADYAQARSIVANRLEVSNQRLADAIAMRNEYKQQVIAAVREFGSILTTETSTLDGIEQALSAGDITKNLTDRLAQIKRFQDLLKQLIGSGLSNDAYKQIVDAGVEQGTQFAEAILGGGTGAIQNINSLVSQINSTAAQLGSETSTRMYQAGVDAAKGLVDGLTSLSRQLDSAATRLGNSIANAVKRALGIRSPSRVMRDMMGSVGDGAVLGLDDQHIKVGRASAALADLIAVNPGGGRPPAGGPVSGNGEGRHFRDLVVNTPTEDPQAVAHEVLNEVVGRL